MAERAFRSSRLTATAKESGENRGRGSSRWEELGCRRGNSNQNRGGARETDRDDKKKRFTNRRLELALSQDGDDAMMACGVGISMDGTMQRRGGGKAGQYQKKDNQNPCHTRRTAATGILDLPNLVHHSLYFLVASREASQQTTNGSPRMARNAGWPPKTKARAQAWTTFRTPWSSQWSP